MDKGLATKAIKEQIADPLGISVEEAAYRIKEVVESNAGLGVRGVLDEKGRNPGDFSVFAFGGASGIHCCGISGNAGFKGRIYTFPTGSVFSAFGSSTMDVSHSYERLKGVVLRSASGEYLADLEEFNGVVAEMQESAYRDMRGEGFPAEAVMFKLELEISCGDVASVVSVPEVLLKSAKDVQYLSRAVLESGKDVKLVCDDFTGKCSVALPKDNIVVNLFKLRASCPVGHYHLKSDASSGKDPSNALKGKRAVFWGNGFEETSVYDRVQLGPGNVIKGPAVIEDEDSTYTVPKGMKYTVDQYMNGIIEKE